MYKILLALLLSAAPVVGGAAVKYNQETLTLEITGDTTRDQAQRVFQIFKEHTVKHVVMYGDGGDFYSGMVIGDLLAKSNVSVSVPENKECISACAFAVLGGDAINVNGYLLFHVPYYPSVPTSGSIEGISQKFGELYIDMTAYLMRRNIPVNFARHLMVQTNRCTFVVVDNGQTIENLKNHTDPLWKPRGYAHRIYSACL